MEETIKRLEIIKTSEGELAIEVLYKDYNIIKETIYNDELAKKILALVKAEETRTEE